MTTIKKRANRPKNQSPSPAAKIVLAVAVAMAIGLLFALTQLSSDEDEPVVARESDRHTDTREVKKPEKAEPISPEFQFYTLLPEQAPSRPVAPPPRVVPEKPAPAIDDTPVDETAEYIIQAGSFIAESDAERRKAELAMLGYSSKVRPAEVAGQTYYRVFVGPLGGEAARQAQQRISKADIETLPRKVITE
ncbi:MAG TPA: hypothetical protein ENM98_02520 [Halothiobacillaceae bacterium]|nr:hypothetical protein [Halothiobacillaceae bacterium]